MISLFLSSFLKNRFDHEMKILELVKNKFEEKKRNKRIFLNHIVCMHETVFIGGSRRAFVLGYCQRGSLEDLSKPLWKNNWFLAPSVLLQFFEQVL